MASNFAHEILLIKQSDSLKSLESLSREQINLLKDIASEQRETIKAIIYTTTATPPNKNNNNNNINHSNGNHDNEQIKAEISQNNDVILEVQSSAALKSLANDQKESSNKLLLEQQETNKALKSLVSESEQISQSLKSLADEQKETNKLLRELVQEQYKVVTDFVGLQAEFMQALKLVASQPIKNESENKNQSAPPPTQPQIHTQTQTQVTPPETTPTKNPVNNPINPTNTPPPLVDREVQNPIQATPVPTQNPVIQNPIVKNPVIQSPTTTTQNTPGQNPIINNTPILTQTPIPQNPIIQSPITQNPPLQNVKIANLPIPTQNPIMSNPTPIQNASHIKVPSYVPLPMNTNTPNIPNFNNFTNFTNFQIPYSAIKNPFTGNNPPQPVPFGNSAMHPQFNVSVTSKPTPYPIMPNSSPQIITQPTNNNNINNNNSNHSSSTTLPTPAIEKVKPLYIIRTESARAICPSLESDIQKQSPRFLVRKFFTDSIDRINEDGVVFICVHGLNATLNPNDAFLLRDFLSLNSSCKLNINILVLKQGDDDVLLLDSNKNPVSHYTWCFNDSGIRNEYVNESFIHALNSLI